MLALCRGETLPPLEVDKGMEGGVADDWAVSTNASSVRSGNTDEVGSGKGCRAGMEGRLEYNAARDGGDDFDFSFPVGIHPLCPSETTPHRLANAAISRSSTPLPPPPPPPPTTTTTTSTKARPSSLQDVSLSAPCAPRLSFPPSLLVKLGKAGLGGGRQQEKPLPRPLRLAPHPKLISRSEAVNWRSLEALAERHLNEFISDCLRRSATNDGLSFTSGEEKNHTGTSVVGEVGGVAGLGFESDSGSSSGGLSSSDEGDFLWDAVEDRGNGVGGGDEFFGGGGLDQMDAAPPSPSNTYERSVQRARRRLLFVELKTGGESVRGISERRALALAYYRVVWARFSAPGNSRPEPHAFPWVVAGDYLVSAVTG